MFDIDLLEGDIVFSGGDILRATGADEVRQRVLLRLRRTLGEWAYNTSLGVDWFGQVLGVPNPDLAVIRSLLLREIAATEGVVRVRALELTLTPDRVLSFSWAAVVDAGDGVVDEFDDNAAVTFDDGEMQFLLEPLGLI